jgi:cytoskeletal protein CcmA (bactofilin family)
MPDPTIIRAQTLVQGNLTGEDPVEVEGQLIGQVALQNTLTVHPGGLARGQLHVTQAFIFGRVEGTLTATERVYLGPSAVVIADVEAPLVRVDDGAKLHGKLLMELDAPAPAVAPLVLPSSKPAAQQTPKTEAKSGFGSFTSSPRPAMPQSAPQPVTTQPVFTAPSFFSTKPTSSPQAASGAQQPSGHSERAVIQPTSSPQAASGAQQPQPARTAVAFIDPEPTPQPVVAIAPTPTQVEEVKAQVAPTIKPTHDLVKETVEEPQDEPDKDSAPDAGEDGAATAYAAEAAKYEHYTVKELREELRRLDLPVSGSKEELIERLISAQ